VASFKKVTIKNLRNRFLAFYKVKIEFLREVLDHPIMFPTSGQAVRSEKMEEFLERKHSNHHIS